MDRYLGGEHVDVETLIGDLERAVARGAFFPVLAAAPAADGARQDSHGRTAGLGTGRLPDPLEHGAPNVTTLDRQARASWNRSDPDAPLVAEVV
ncbi:hypothetical protein GCM10023238_27890 [Streptomyces heliomycini]